MKKRYIAGMMAGVAVIAIFYNMFYAREKREHKR